MAYGRSSFLIFYGNNIEANLFVRSPSPPFQGEGKGYGKGYG